MRNSTSVNYDFDEMIREARLQRTAAIAHGIVDAAAAIGHAVRSVFGMSARKSTLAKLGS